MNKPKSANIIILGCGMSGMITALRLAHLNISSTIIETTDLNTNLSRDNRTTALTSTSKDFFAEIGLWNELKDHCATINDIYVVDNKSPTMLHFISPQEASQAMGYLIQNQILKKILSQTVQNNSLIKIIDKCKYQKIEVDDSKATIYLEKTMEAVIADLVIVCDGKNSLAKNYYFTADLLKYYHQHALTFNVSHAINHQGTAVEHFLPSGPFAILPLVGGYSSSIVWTVSDKMIQQLLDLEQDEFLYLVKQNFGSFLGDISIISDVQSFPLWAYHAEHYFYKCLVLVADSAHVIHPLAGQGLNQGIKDIVSLTSNIANLGINELALTKYQRQRKADNHAMYLITDNLNKIFSNNSSLWQNARRIGFQAINALPSLQNHLVKYAMGKRSI